MRALLRPGLSLFSHSREEVCAPVLGRPRAAWVAEAARASGAVTELVLPAGADTMAGLLGLPVLSAAEPAPEFHLDAAACWMTPEWIGRAVALAASGPARGVLRTPAGAIAGPLGFDASGGRSDAAELAVPAAAIDFHAAGSNAARLAALLRAHRTDLPAPRPVRLFVTDVDGVLTDAGFYYDERGEALKKFSTRDGAGLVHLLRSGVTVGIITGEKTGFTTARAAKLGISRIELGCSNKLPVLDAWRRELGLDWEEVAYIGDDLPDIPCLRAAGASACPADAEPEVRAVSLHPLAVEGGRGAVRALIRLLQSDGRVPPNLVS